MVAYAGKVLIQNTELGRAGFGGYDGAQPGKYE